MEDRRGEWRRGWPVVLAAIGGMMTVAAPSAITGLVMEPLQRSFHWSRAEITVNVLIVSLCALVLAPVVGGFIARLGVRRVALAGVVTTALGFTVVGISGPGIWSWLAAWLIYGALSIALGPIVWTSALSSIFDRHRGLALSIALSGGGFAFAVWPPLVTPLIAAHSWRWAYFFLAAAAILVVLPLNLVSLRTLRREPARAGARAAAPAVPWGATLGEALRTTRFWRLGFAMVVAAGAEGSLLIHFYPILDELHFSSRDAAYLTTLVGPAMIVGRILSGWLMDRLFAPLVAAAAAALPVVTCLVLMSGPGVGVAAVGALALGVSVGTANSAGAYLVGRYFGLRDFASIYGVLIGAFGVGYGVFPVLTGHFYDVTGTYSPLFPFLALAVLASAALFATLGHYPVADGAPARTGPRRREEPLAPPRKA